MTSDRSDVDIIAIVSEGLERRLVDELTGRPVERPVAMISKRDGSMHPYEQGRYYSPDAWEPVYAKTKGS